MSFRSSLAVLLLLGTFQVRADEPPARQWVVVVQQPLVDAVEPLAERRAEQGWRVERVVLPADRDAEPDAVRDRIAERSKAFDGTTVVLLVGDYAARGVPAFEGRHGRMTGEPTDHPYGLPNEREASTIAVGRLPARDVDDVRAMVAKTLALEDRPVTPDLHRIHLMIGDPGAKTRVEERFARALVGNLAETRLAMLHPMWRPVCVADSPGTRFATPGEAFDTAARRLLADEHLLAGYAGHSGAAGLWAPARRAYSVDREAFEKIDNRNAPGLLVSCGCFGCQVEGAGGIGYVVAAMRNPRGPAAGIGAYAESYAAFGQFALDAVVGRLTTDDPARTLGDYWLAAQNGLVRGEMNAFQFFLYDRADGSGGKVPLADQRLEHAEMWTLLGDPGLRLPFVRPTLPVTVEGKAEPNGTLRISTTAPASVTAGKVTLLVEPRQLRWADVGPAEAAPLVERTTKLDGQPFEVTLPAELPEGSLVVRVWIETADDTLYGVTTVARPAEPPSSD